MPVTIDLYGNKIQHRTQSTTALGALEEKGIELKDGDKVFPSPDEKITRDMTIFVLQVGEDIVTRTEVIPHETEIIYDVDRPASYRKVKTAGSNGERIVVYREKRNKDGKLVSQKVLQSVVVKNPVKEVVVKGNQLSGTKTDWLLASGIPKSDWQYVDQIIQRESGWNPLAENPSSGAGGLPQALPYSKTGCAWGDAVCQLKWADGYAKGRYGSWSAAHSFWEANHWW